MFIAIFFVGLFFRILMAVNVKPKRGGRRGGRTTPARRRRGAPVRREVHYVLK